MCITPILILRILLIKTLKSYLFVSSYILLHLDRGSNSLKKPSLLHAMSIFTLATFYYIVSMLSINGLANFIVNFKKFIKNPFDDVLSPSITVFLLPLLRFNIFSIQLIV